MLVLSRKQKQQIQIGGEVVLTVLQIKGGSVRLGIEAPRDIHVLRGELAQIRDPGKTLGAATPQPRATEGSTPPEEPTKLTGLRRRLQLKNHTGTQEETIAPTRLTDIAKAIPSLHLPR